MHGIVTIAIAFTVVGFMMIAILAVALIVIGG